METKHFLAILIGLEISNGFNTSKEKGIFYFTYRQGEILSEKQSR